MKYTRQFSLVILCVFGLSNFSFAQEQAINTSSNINVEPYAQVIHEPLDEISGIVKSRGRDNLYWVHNDSGDDARIFAINSDGETVMPTYSKFTRYGGEPEEGKEPWQGFKILYAENRDWEDMTVDDNYIYISDLGNNNNDRHDLMIYAIGEIDPTASTQAAVIKGFPVRYPDQTRFPPSGSRPFDSESLFAADGNLYVITKHRKTGRGSNYEAGAKLYRLDTEYTDQDNVLTLIDNHSEMIAATAAEVSPDGQRLAVLSYTAIWLFDKPEQGDQWLSSTFTKFNLNESQARQVEAIVWEDNDTLLFLNEQRDMFRLNGI